MPDIRLISLRLLALALVVLGLTAATITSTAAQPFMEIAGGSVVGRANALAARIHAFHRWTGSPPPPASYCPTMRAGEAAMVELSRLSNRAIRYHQSGLALHPTAFIPVRCQRRLIPLAQSCCGSSNRECLPVAGRRMLQGPRSTRVER